MAEIKVSKDEVAFLKNKISKAYKNNNTLTFTSVSPPKATHLTTEAKTIQLKWNSSVNNYVGLAKAMNDSLMEHYHDEGKGNEMTEYSIPATFLRNFFYYEKDSKNVRVSSMDKLYLYLFEKTRANYLSEKRADFFTKKHLLYHLKSTHFDKIKELDECYNFDSIDLLQSVESLLLESKNKNNIIYLYIDYNFLINENGAKLLVTLFYEYFLSLVLDRNIELIFDDELFDYNQEYNIVSLEGRANIFKVFSENYNILNILFGEKMAKQITGKAYFLILQNLLYFFVTEKESLRKVNIDDFLPILNELMGSEPKNIKTIYENESNDVFNFFCVTGEDKYPIEEKEKMFKYFFSFRKDKLKNSSATRIFAIPSKRIKNKSWSSQLDSESNSLLYQYILMNIKGGVETYIQMYDENSEELNRGILWNQNYVLKIKKEDNKDSSLNENGHFDNLINNSKLYFAYSKTEKDINQVLEITPSHSQYIRRMYQDFIVRHLERKVELPVFLSKEINENNLDFLQSKLNIKELGKKKLKKLEEEVKYFFEK